MAMLLGHRHFTSESSQYDEMSGDWRWEEVFIEGKLFLTVMADAIGVYDRSNI